MSLPSNIQIGVLGAGSWGTALAQTFSERSPLALWHRDPAVADSINERRKNPKVHSEISLNPKIHATSDLLAVCQQVKILVYALPSHVAWRMLPNILAALPPETLLINTAKGIDTKMLETFSGLVRSQWGKTRTSNQYMMLSGPSFAKEVLNRLPTLVELACENISTAEEMAQMLSTDRFLLMPGKNVLGVEWAGAAKNVMAIAIGASDALGLGQSARAGLISMGLREMQALSASLGQGDWHMFTGPAWLGDLVLTCTGDLSRNRRLGMLLGQGRTIPQALKQLGQVAEGLRTTKAIHKIAKNKRLNMPIVETMHQTIFESRPIAPAIENLLKKITV